MSYNTRLPSCLPTVGEFAFLVLRTPPVSLLFSFPIPSTLSFLFFSYPLLLFSVSFLTYFSYSRTFPCLIFFFSSFSLSFLPSYSPSSGMLLFFSFLLFLFSVLFLSHFLSFPFFIRFHSLLIISTMLPFSFNTLLFTLL